MAEIRGIAPNTVRWWSHHARIWKERGLDRDRPEEHRAVVAAFNGDGPILEIGCAFGALCKHLPPDVDYLGIDVCPDMVHECRVRHPKRLFAVRSVFDMDTHALAGAFAWAVALQTLEHFGLEDLERIMRVLRRVSRRGLVFSVPRGEPSEADRENNGHVLGWVDETALCLFFERWGDVRTFDCGDEKHMGGVLKWR